MKQQEIEGILRTFILGTLVERSGKVLTPDVIGEITAQLQQVILDWLERSCKGGCLNE